MFLLLDIQQAVEGLRFDNLVVTPDLAVAHLTSIAPSAPCPGCGTSSDRVHSHYRRTVADLPCQGQPVAVRLLLRRFRCAQAACPRTVFCERLPGLLQAYARSTDRLTDSHRDIGFALGGAAGARLAKHLDMPTSPDTLLRRVKDAPDEPAPSPRYVGVDDWALRKGQRYGTDLIDLERGRVLDLLLGRDGAAVKAWLQDHPGVKLITRDRWAPYAQAAAVGAPEARQVADRWHLLKNLREAVERLLGRLAVAVHAALREPAPVEGLPPTAGVIAAPVEPAAVTLPSAALTASVAISAPAPTFPATGAVTAGVPSAAATKELPAPPTVAAPADVSAATRPAPSARERTRQARRQQRAEQYQRV